MPTTPDDDGDNLVEQALDLFVYAPLGLALEARDLLPKLADRGRGQVALARLAGRLAAQQRQRSEARATPSSAPESAPPDTVARIDAPAESDLPIDDFSTLSATQILPLLKGLDADALQAVLDFETANRGRVTVTNRINKLLS